MLYLQMADDFIGKFGWQYHLNNTRKPQGPKVFSLEDCLKKDPKALLIRSPQFLPEDTVQLDLSKAINTTLIAIDHACKKILATGTDDLEYNIIFATTCADNDPDLAQIMPYIVEEITPQEAVDAWNEFTDDVEIENRVADVIRLGAAYDARKTIELALIRAANDKSSGSLTVFMDNRDIEISNIELMFWGLENVIPPIESRLSPFTEHADSASIAIRNAYEKTGKKDPIAEELCQWGRNWKTAIELNDGLFYNLRGTIDAQEIISKIVKDIPSAKQALAAGVPFCDIVV